MPSVSFLPFLQAVPFATRILTLTLVLFSVSALLLSILAQQNSPNSLRPGESLPWLVLIPGESWKYPWTLLTAGWVELSIFELVFSAVSLPLACRYLERIWGSKELVRFCCIVIVGSNIIAFGFSWLMWIVLRQEEALFGLPYHGLSGLQVGFLVAFTQLIPEHQLQLLGVLKVRVKTLPGIYLLISNVLTIVLGPSPYILIQFGFFVAWVYLRFFKLSDDGLTRGDRSEAFAFMYWFPPPVRPYIAIPAGFVFKQAVKFRLVQSWDEPMQSGGYSILPGPGGARAEAERRRAMALKALDARLASGSPAPGTSSTSATAAVPSIPAAAEAAVAAVVSAADAVVPPPLKTAGSTRNVAKVDDLKETKERVE
ncbi:eukaryotic integral membrane protein-domain-containing protein [Naematelia encephala]|uniref:Eukaryotic integral membrane protein-domain-containing protein n=1 Tax=Naematelia encephala TaxID=71784 RepID=A0A1Y2B1D7_9TREE|nr:eukaryotic integral membrane protein-domain-containing protein [Naematelia encephala]